MALDPGDAQASDCALHGHSLTQGFLALVHWRVNGQEGVHGCRNAVPTHSETLPVQFAVLADDGKVVVKLIDYVASCTTSVAALMDDSAYGDGVYPDIHCKFCS